ncbi:MAG: DUF424 family protein [Candidatus Korarchaeota archaeon]|nr:DUF424 family protein [Candidatus Korarchaeota archaeon]
MRETGGAYVKVHRVGGDVMLAACDEELRGKRFEEGTLRIEVSKTFYGGFRAELDELVEYMRQATIMNLVGKRVVSAAVEAGYVHPEAVIKIAGVPHAQVVSVRW